VAAPFFAAGALGRPGLLGRGSVAPVALIRRNKQFLAFVAVVLTAALITGHVARQEAQTNYENQLAACKRTQPVRVGNYSFYTATARARHKSARNDRDPVQRRIDAEFAREAKKLADNLLRPAHVRSDGSVNCKEAIQHP